MDPWSLVDIGFSEALRNNEFNGVNGNIVADGVIGNIVADDGCRVKKDIGADGNIEADDEKDIGANENIEADDGCLVEKDIEANGNIEADNGCLFKKDIGAKENIEADDGSSVKNEFISINLVAWAGHRVGDYEGGSALRFN